MSHNTDDYILNDDQQKVFDAWLNSSDNIFCTGHGGTGKSMLLEQIVKSVRSPAVVERYGKIPTVAVTAPTGTAAFNIGGITIHRFAGIGIETENIGRMVARASTPANKRMWTTTDVLIIDEISMVSGIFFSNLYALAQTIRNSDEPFGGMRLLVFGDFLQLPPPSGFSFRAFRAFECEAWKNCNMTTFLLTQTVRQSDRDFIALLKLVRIGLCNDEVAEYIRSLSRTVEYDDGIEPVKLFALKKPAEAYNAEKLSEIDDDLHKFEAIDSGNNASLTACPGQQILELKKGAKVMLIRNLTKDLVNGSIGIVKGFTELHNVHVPVVDMIGSGGNIQEVVITRVSWESIAPNGAVIARRIQIPLILSWAITIHRSQSKTIPRLIVNMAGIFETGQAYVALSRCKSPDHLQVVNFKESYIQNDAKSVEFYNDLECTLTVSEGSAPPDYETVAALPSDPPMYHPSATNVAPSTETEWGPAIADTQLMRGNLSIDSLGETLESFNIGSDN